MATTERSIDRARRRATEDLRAIGAETRRARMAGGVSLRDVESRTRVPYARISRFERGLGSLDLTAIYLVACAVGLDARIRAWPGGDPIRDAGQARLLERLHRQLPAVLRWRTEVPLPIPGDLRAWDAMVSGPGWRLAIEAETVLGDIQAVERRLALKRRDGGIERVLVLVADTPRNRRARAAAPAAFADLPGRPREILAALRAGRDPRASALVFL
jgi:transcriptional regulator with XRE-family HTH domain